MTVDLKQCLSDLFSLSTVDCDCIEENRPDDWNQSTTGYSITDMEYGVSILYARYLEQNCLNGQNIWQVLQNAKNDAIRDTLDDIGVSMYSKKETKYKVFSGDIGKKKLERDDSIKTRFAGLRFQPKNIKGGCIEIEKVCLGLNCDANVTVQIYSSDTGLLKEVVVSALSGKFECTELDEKLSLPTYSESCDHLEYYFVYEVPEGCRPLNNKLKCCGNSPGWLDFMTAGGFETNDLNFDSLSCSNFARGLSIEACFRCEALDWICELEDCGGKPFRALLARTLIFKAGVKVLSQILASGSANLMLGCDETKLKEMRANRQQWYNSNISYICENLPDNINDCYQCAKDKRFSKKSILV